MAIAPVVDAGLAEVPAAEIRWRAVAATLAVIARTGLGKLTVDDVAREAGCARATLYRSFQSKRDLLATTVESEANRVVTAVLTASATAATLEDSVVAALHTAAAEIAAHDALRFVTAHEAPLLLPHITFAGADRVLRWARSRIAPCFTPFLPDADADRLAEWVVRLGLCLLFSQGSPVELSDPAAIRAYVRAFVLPAFPTSVTTRGSS